MHHFVEIWFSWVLNWGYLGIILLMAMESSIFPVPSEVVIPPAAFLAAQGHLSFSGVVIAGTVGSYLGSAITYWVSRAVGRPLIMQYGKYFLLSPDKITRAEVWLARYEAGGIFFARLLPVIRHLISIPAGIVRMNFWIFSAATIIGSAIWCFILATLGRKAFAVQPDLIHNPDAMVHFIKSQSLWIVVVVVVFTALYFLMLRLTARKGA
ncbi:MAG: DedA family protein [Chthoniobacterales bacterium]|nr:DedA family protein [Chthoniobacterales bacterium]